MNYRSFPLQLFVFVVLPLTTLMLAISFGSLGLHQQAMRRMVGERDERATRAAAAAISEQIEHRGSVVRGLAGQVAVYDDPQHVLRDASFIMPNFEAGIALLDSDGAVLAASENAQEWLPQVENTPTQTAESADQSPPPFMISQVQSLDGQELMLISASSTEGFTALGAFNLARLAQQTLKEVVDATDQAAVIIVNDVGEMIYQDGALYLDEPDVRDFPGVAAALAGDSGTTYHSLSGEEHVIAFSPIFALNWALVIEEPWREVADPLLRITELAPLLLVPIVAITLFALWFGVRQIVQPLQSLEQKATELGWGRYEAIEEPVGGINEIQRLQTELIHMAQKVKLAQQSLRGYLGAVTAGQEEERRRLARDLHDDTIQSLIALNQRLQIAQLSAGVDLEQIPLADMQQMVSQTIADLRRLTHDLRPIYLEDLGLVPALDMLARDTSRNQNITINFQATGEEQRLAPEVELALYRMGQEALSNVVRHAQARRAEMVLAFTADAVQLSVSDDGAGFSTPGSPAEMAATGHFGLLGIQERAELINARFILDSSPGTGTRLMISVPNNTPYVV